MRHRTDICEKLSRALQLYDQGVSSSAIGERLGISSKEAARTIHQAKKRRAKTELTVEPKQDGIVYPGVES